jgi:hypothetical protein
MGYYANAIEGSITIAQENQDGALRSVVSALTKLNEGRETWGRVETYEAYDSIHQVLTDEGFDYAQEDNGDLVVFGFDAKWREQETMLNALADYVTKDSYLGFVGEDYALWKWTPNGVVEGRITW